MGKMMINRFKAAGTAGGWLLAALTLSAGGAAAQTTNTAADASRPGYFGAVQPTTGSTTANPGVPKPAATPQDAPVTVAVATPAPVVPAPTPRAATTAQMASPVGKWHWHSGGEKVIAASGAVLQDSKVVGQWGWNDRSKGEFQIRFSSLGGRPPMTYSLSPHGNHLNGTDPARKGQTFVEERTE